MNQPRDEGTRRGLLINTDKTQTMVFGRNVIEKILVEGFKIKMLKDLCTSDAL